MRNFFKDLINKLKRSPKASTLNIGKIHWYYYAATCVVLTILLGIGSWVLMLQVLGLILAGVLVAGLLLIVIKQEIDWYWLACIAAMEFAIVYLPVFVIVWQLGIVYVVGFALTLLIAKVIKVVSSGPALRVVA